MNKNIRIIPKLDIKGPNLVKGIHLEGLRVLGKPEDFARYYYESGADELIYMDVVASLYNRNSLHEIIQRTAKDIFIPITVGGGLRTIEDIRAVLRAGADKVALNTAAIKNPDIIKEAARKFGSSTIVVSIEAIKQPDGIYLAYTDNGREHTGLEVKEWAQKAAELGAGEIMLTSVDQEGTGLGYDVELTKMVSDAVWIPVIACGGAGKIEDLKDVVLNGNADALSLASVLHYGFVKQQVLKNELYAQEGNIEYLKSGREFSKIETATLPQIKKYLSGQGIDCRYCDKREFINAG
ncbi:MAG: imidazole glycerol phosphate synthase subunit HisF [Candidatus Omnitrophota bacterium]